MSHNKSRCKDIQRQLSKEKMWKKKSLVLQWIRNKIGKKPVNRLVQYEKIQLA